MAVKFSNFFERSFSNLIFFFKWLVCLIILFKKDFLISKNLRNIISTNKSKISIKDILSWGDDYQLVFTANKKYNNQINKLGKKNNIKLTHIGTVIKDKGIFDDSMSLIKNPSRFDHFS